MDGRRYRLGAAGWAALSVADEPAPDLVFGVDGVELLSLSTDERLRPGAASEVSRLRGEGFDVEVVSGDEPERVVSLAGRLGLPREAAHGGLSPEAKERFVAAKDRGDTLFVGDGINDSLAVGRALVSGTPAVDRPFMPARTDFYLLSPGLAPVALALRAATKLAQTVRLNLVLAILYNVAAVSLAWAGLMQPWMAAVLMPLSSLLTLSVTSARLSRRSPLWMS